MTAAGHGLLSMTLAVLCATTLAITAYGAMTEAMRIAAVDKHNELRAMVTSPTAADMLEVEYDMDLETIAQGYADQCIWGT